MDELNQDGGDVPSDPKPRPKLPVHAPADIRKGWLRMGSEVQFVSVPLGLLPRKLQSVTRHSTAFRRLIEDAVLKVHGRVDLYAANLIHSAVLADRSRRILENLFLKHADKLSVEQTVLLQSRVVSLAKERNAALEKLGIGKSSDKHERLWNAIDATGSEAGEQ